MEKQNASPLLASSPWWIQLCDWLSRQRGFVWGNIILGIILNVLATWLVTPAGSTFSNTPLGVLFVHPLITVLAGTGLIVLSIIVTLVARYSRGSSKFFEHQQDAYQFLMNIIDRYGAKEAVFIQYSCHTSLNILRILLRKGAKVTVFIQHEDTPAKLGSQFQAHRVIHTTMNLREELGDALLKPNKLMVYKYHVPCSMSAIKIDNRVLCMGWYTYEQKAPSDHKTYPADTTSISGHDRAAVVAWKGTNDFRALHRTFAVLEKNYRKYAESVLI
jgi:hypothetical protein